MITIRKANERGHANHGWLDTWHTFSFADYYDPEQMGFRTLRVINEDRVAPGRGFGTHPHRDMEIITHVLEGALEHKDSMGHVSVIPAGEFQRMTAGTGVTHSEYNHSATDPVHLLQIWILPERKGLTPGYEQRPFDLAPNQLTLVASPDGRDGGLTIHQDAELYAARLTQGGSINHAIKPGRHAWLQVAIGNVSLNSATLQAGDGAAISGESEINIRATGTAEVLLFDLA